MIKEVPTTTVQAKVNRVRRETPSRVDRRWAGGVTLRSTEVKENKQILPGKNLLGKIIDQERENIIDSSARISIWTRPLRLKETMSQKKAQTKKNKPKPRPQTRLQRMTTPVSDIKVI